MRLARAAKSAARSLSDDAQTSHSKCVAWQLN